jgi:hypothetical protein
MKSSARRKKPQVPRVGVGVGQDRANCSPRASLAYSALLTMDDLKLKFRKTCLWFSGLWRTAKTTSLPVSVRNESERG